MLVINLLLSIISWLELTICFIIYFPIHFIIFLITAPFDKQRRILHYNTSLLCFVILIIVPILRVKIIGRENIDRSKAHVVVMNHQSLLDVLFIFTLFYPAKMMAKKTLAAVPVVGWTLSLNKHIFIDRANRKSQIDALRRMDQLLIDGDSLMVYPEGTRTKDGDIAEFKKGAFRSAVATGTSVLPVVIKGAFEALPSKSMVVKGFHTITLSVLPSIDVEKGSSTADLAQKCHDLMSSELEHLRQA